MCVLVVEYLQDVEKKNERKSKLPRVDTHVAALPPSPSKLPAPRRHPVHAWGLSAGGLSFPPPLLAAPALHLTPRFLCPCSEFSGSSSVFLANSKPSAHPLASIFPSLFTFSRT